MGSENRPTAARRAQAKLVELGARNLATSQLSDTINPSQGNSAHWGGVGRGGNKIAEKTQKRKQNRLAPPRPDLHTKNETMHLGDPPDPPELARTPLRTPK